MRMPFVLALAAAAAAAGDAPAELVMGAVTVGTNEVAPGAALAPAPKYTERSVFRVATTLTAGGAAVDALAMAAVRFTHTATGVEVWAPLARAGDAWAAEMNLPRDAEQLFYYASGEYAVAVLAADPQYAAGVERAVGKVHLRLAASPRFAQKMEHADLARYARRPPHAWDMAPRTEKQGSATAATLFSGALAVPYVALFALLAHASLPPAKMAAAFLAMPVKNIVFLGVLYAMCGLCFLYWTALSLATVAVYFAVLATAAFAVRPRPAVAVAKAKAD